FTLRFFFLASNSHCHREYKGFRLHPLRRLVPASRAPFHLSTPHPTQLFLCSSSTAPMPSKPSSAMAVAAASPAGGGGVARLEALAMDKVAEAADAVAIASSAGEVVRAIHAVAVLLFPVDSATVAGTLDEPIKSQVRVEALFPCIRS
uniref:Uncharacterized protein n=1 Tax=Triticum urartu TaxID=4572 RepID=A0A8R7UTZ4_TRIUA